MGAEILVLIAVVLILVGFLAWYMNFDVATKASEVVETSVEFFEKFTHTSTKGDEIVTQIPKTDSGDSEEVIPELAENHTKVVEIANENKIQICYQNDPNGCFLSGYAKLVNPVSGQVIKPYTYTYIFYLECAEIANGWDYCHTDDVQADGFTSDGGKDKDGNELGGYYEYTWRPYEDDFRGLYDGSGKLIQKGLYDVDVWIRSKKLPETDRYEEFSDKYQVELR